MQRKVPKGTNVHVWWQKGEYHFTCMVRPTLSLAREQPPWSLGALFCNVGVKGGIGRGGIGTILTRVGRPPPRFSLAFCGPTEQFHQKTASTSCNGQNSEYHSVKIIISNLRIFSGFSNKTSVTWILKPILSPRFRHCECCDKINKIQNLLTKLCWVLGRIGLTSSTQ